MGLGHQKQLRQRIECHTDRNMVFRLIAKPRNDQTLSVLITGTAVSHQQEVRFLTSQKLTYPGKALTVRSSLTVLTKLLCRSTAQPFLNGFGISCLLLLLHDIPQLTAGQFPAQLQKLRNGDVDMDIVGLPLPCRFVHVIGSEGKMRSAVTEGIRKAFNETVPCILTDDLTCVSLILQYDTSMDFLPQFNYNVENLLKLLDDIPKLKRMVRHAG